MTIQSKWNEEDLETDIVDEAAVYHMTYLIVQ